MVVHALGLNRSQSQNRARRSGPVVSTQQRQQLRWQRFSGLGKPEKCNDSTGNGDYVPPPCRPKLHANAAVLNFQYSRVVNQALSGHWQFGWPAEQSDDD